MPNLSKPLVVPQFGNYSATAPGGITPPLTVNLFVQDGATPSDQASVDLVTLSAQPQLDFPYPKYVPSPNVCAVVGADLYVSLSAANPVGDASPCDAVLQFAGYFNGANANNRTSNVKATLFNANANFYQNGLAFDGGTTLGGGVVGAGYLYTVQDNSIWAYPVPTTGTGASNVTGTAIVTDTGQAHTPKFADMAFDAQSNLWVVDYNNNSVLVFPKATLGTTNAFTIITAGNGPFKVTSTSGGTAATIFASPEGIAFDGAGNLWVGNNNDYGNLDGSNPLSTTLTTLVQITPALQTAILTPYVATYSLAPTQALTLANVQSASPPAGFAIYTLPTPSNGERPQLGGMQIDAISATDLSSGLPQYLYVNDETSNTVRQFDINPSSSGFIASLSDIDATALTLNDTAGNPVVTNPGNGGIALVYANLLIGDSMADAGAEPDNGLQLDSENNPIFWESPNIGVATGTTPPVLTAPFTAYTSVTTPLPPDTNVYVYVNVTNIGCTATTGTERLRVYWASGATTQAWPESWTEITTTPTFVQAALLPGASAVATILWPPTLYPTDSGNTHYCLLARIETMPVYPFGMTYWENEVTSGPAVGNMDYNVVSNAKIAQCNIYIGPQVLIIQPPRGVGGHMPPVHIGITAGNLGSTPSRIRLGFQLLNPAGASIPFDSSRLVIHTKQSLCDRLIELVDDFLEHLGEGLFHMKAPSKGFGHISLGPKEMVPLHVEFTPPDGLTDFALRAMQYDVVDGKSRLAGGQTFVFGKVAGINT
jgi:hypothetical protein